jgi:hypothetical protein
MYYQFPLQALARSRRAGSQIEFAREACRVLEETDDLALEPVHDGLAIFAANEDALAVPARILAEVYSDSVVVRAPSVRLIDGDPAHEPVMNVRVRAKRCYMPAVLAALRYRGARVVEECLKGREFVVRAEAPMRRLMGLSAEMAMITEGTSSSWVYLSRYQPVSGD